MSLYLGTNKVDIMGPSEGYMTNGMLIAKKEYEIKLSDTNYSSLTPTTSAQTLTLPATTYTTSPNTTITCFKLGQDYDGTIINRSAYGYTALFEFQIEFVYSSSVTGTIHGVRYGYAKDFVQYGYPSSFNSTTGVLNVNNINNNTNTYTSNSSRLLYQKADNTYATSTNSYGIYISLTPLVCNSNNIELRLSGVSIKYNDTYFPLAAMQAINTTSTKMKATWYVYQGDSTVASRLYTRASMLASN